MVLDLLGLSIEAVFNNCDKNFSLKTTIMLSEQMVIFIYHSYQELNIFIQNV
jgi:hypothetical protein